MTTTTTTTTTANTTKIEAMQSPPQLLESETG